MSNPTEKLLPEFMLIYGGNGESQRPFDGYGTDAPVPETAALPRPYAGPSSGYLYGEGLTPEALEAYEGSRPMRGDTERAEAAGVEPSED